MPLIFELPFNNELFGQQSRHHQRPSANQKLQIFYFLVIKTKFDINTLSLKY